MSIEFRARITADGLLSFGAPRTEAMMRARLKKYAGCYVECQLDQRESAAKRRFFEGPVVQYWFYQNPNSKWLTFAEARENIKLRWHSRNSYDQYGNPQKHVKSTKMSGRRFSEMLLQMQTDWIEEGYEWPDPVDYEAWLKTEAPDDMQYPPLEKLKKGYQKKVVYW